MPSRIFIEDKIGQNCASLDDGAKLLDLILPELLNDSSVELDFKGINSVLTPFLNSCFGKLLERFGKEKIMTHLIIRNVSDQFFQRINQFIDYKDEELTKSIERETLQSLFDEDDLTDTTL